VAVAVVSSVLKSCSSGSWRLVPAIGRSLQTDHMCGENDRQEASSNAVLTDLA
jgi:hypothetical protein